MKFKAFKFDGKFFKTVLIVIFCVVTAVCNYISIKGLYSKDAVITLSDETAGIKYAETQAAGNAETVELAEEEPTEPVSVNSSETINTEADISDDALVNLNTATKEELMTLKGIGESKASAIIEYRQAYGGFLSAEEITEVKGIGEKIYSNIKDSITI